MHDEILRIANIVIFSSSILKKNRAIGYLDRRRRRCRCRTKTLM